MHHQAHKTALIFIAVAIAPLLAGLGALFVYDPLQVFHRPWMRGTSLYSNLRLQVAGVIRREPFDSVILGTSVMENTSADEAGQLLGGRFINISLTASDFVERAVVLGYLLKQRRVDQVIYSMDSVYSNSRTGYPLYPMNTWDFLYDGNRLNDFRVYLNTHFLECLSQWSRTEACIGRPVSLNRPNSWFSDPEQAARFGGLDKWCQARDNYQIKDARDALAKALIRMKPGGDPVPNRDTFRQKVTQALGYIDQHVIKLVTANPEVRFRLVFPPYSRTLYAIWHQSLPLNSAIHLAALKHLVAATTQLPNVEVYGFEDENFLDDLGNYKDLVHYRETFDSFILTAIARGEHRLTSANVDQYLSTLATRARAVDLLALASRLESCNGTH